MLFKDLSKYLENIEKISSRLEMTNLLSELFKNLDLKSLDRTVYLIQGKLLPDYYGIDFGIGEKFVIEAISSSTGYSKAKINSMYSKIGDLGEIAKQLLSEKKQQSLTKRELDIDEVYNILYKLSVSKGVGSQTQKIRYLKELLNNADPNEAVYIVRMVLGKLRLGIGDATILDALSFVVVGKKEKREEIERAYNLCSDLGLVAKEFLKNPESIGKFKITLFKPLRVALAERAIDAQEIYKRLGACALEYKYDGFRIQVHKNEDKIQIFTRKLERIEHMLPDIVEKVKKLKQKTLIFEGEALAFNKEKNKFFSFQETMHRRRKYGIADASKSYPLYVFVFDILYADSEDLTVLPFEKRRQKIEKIFKGSEILKPSQVVIADSVNSIQSFFQDSIEKGLEGIMAKDLSAPYRAGKRGFYWIKLKKGYSESVDTIDALIMGYYYGKGSRAKFGFGGLLVAVYNDNTDKFETIAKIGSGFTEQEMIFFKENLDKIKIPIAPKFLSYKLEADIWVEPKYVVEIAYDEITLSSQHTCYEHKEKGYALRFPRFLKLREDKDIYDVTTSKEVDEIYKKV